jgi:hypothetical protein
MTVSELFNIQSIPETLRTLSSSVSTSKIYINMVEFYCGDPSPNKGYIVYYQSLHLPSSTLISGLCSLLHSTSNDATNSSYRNMHSFKFYLLAVLGYIAMIGATPLGNCVPAEAIDLRQVSE